VYSYGEQRSLWDERNSPFVASVCAHSVAVTGCSVQGFVKGAFECEEDEDETRLSILRHLSHRIPDPGWTSTSGAVLKRLYAEGASEAESQIASLDGVKKKTEFGPSVDLLTLRTDLQEWK